MTVGDLIQQLLQYPSKSLVVLSRDSEGNSFHPLDDVDGDLLYDGSEKEVYSEDDEYDLDDVVEAVVLWPRS